MTRRGRIIHNVLIAPLAAASGLAGLNGIAAFALLYIGGHAIVRRLQAHAAVPAADASFADRRSFYVPLAGWWLLLLAYAAAMTALSGASHRWIVTGLFAAGIALPLHCAVSSLRIAARDA